MCCRTVSKCIEIVVCVVVQSDSGVCCNVVSKWIEIMVM